MHWRKSSRFSLSERDHMKWSKQNEQRSVWKSSKACNEWEEIIKSSMIEQSTFEHVTRKVRSSENRNAVSIEKSCKMLNNSQEDCSKLQNEQEMQLQTYWLKRQFSLWSSQNALTLSQQCKIKWRWCFKLTFYHLQRFSCWT